MRRLVILSIALALLLVLLPAPLSLQAAFPSASALSDTDPSLDWNTFLGGQDADGSESVVLGPTGDIFIAGTSALIWGSPIRPFSKGSDAFVARYHPNGGLKWLTFLGGKGDDAGHALVVDSQGSITLTGIGSRSDSAFIVIADSVP